MTSMADYHFNEYGKCTDPEGLALYVASNVYAMIKTAQLKNGEWVEAFDYYLGPSKSSDHLSEKSSCTYLTQREAIVASLKRLIGRLGEQMAEYGYKINPESKLASGRPTDNISYNGTDDRDVSGAFKRAYNHLIGLIRAQIMQFRQLDLFKDGYND